MNEQLRTNAEEDIPQARDMGKPESLENSVADTLPCKSTVSNTTS